MRKGFKYNFFFIGKLDNIIELQKSLKKQDVLLTQKKKKTILLLSRIMSLLIKVSCMMYFDKFVIFIDGLLS